MKINVLDKSIFTKIAAGEVVEKPASVVKELVENAIDAGATNVTIEVVEGGIKLIKVADNGVGMEFSQLPLAFLPHATSKISTVEDLEKIGTLGFRGEALSSIASVSKVVATTKTHDSDLGSRIEIHGGEVISLTEVGSANGTTILVEELFYCIPARAKFLRKARQEAADVTNIVSRLILAHPQIAFKYVSDGKIVFLTQNSTLLDAIYAVYGKNTRDNLFSIDYEREYFKISGYISKPTFSKSNRTYQTLLINGRYVVNQTISTAVYKAYEGFLMKGNFPLFVINLTLPLDKIDVNVHPNKLDVKFEENSKIFGLFLSAVSHVLYENSHVKTLEENDNFIFMPQNNAAGLQNLTSAEGKTFESANSSSIKTDNFNSETILKNMSNIAGNSTQEREEYSKKMNSLDYFLNDSNVKEFVVKQDHGLSHDMVLRSIEHDRNMEVENSAKNVNLFTSTAKKIIGTLFNTYIIVEQDNFAYFIDQHAAHERILYDKFKKQFEEKTLHIEQLLVPYVLELNYLESEFINNNLNAFREAGFEIQPFGANSFKVNTTPLLLKDISIYNFFETVLKEVNNPNFKITPSQIMEDYLARSACRTAVKANDLLSDNEIEILLNSLNESNQVLLCPHGRPVVIKIPKTDLEKWFKRIV